MSSMLLWKYFRLSITTAGSSLSTASIAVSIFVIMGPALASMAFDTMKNQDSSSVPVCVRSDTKFCGWHKSMPSWSGLQFQRFNAAYVAIGWTSNRSAASRNATDICGGRRCKMLARHRTIYLIPRDSPRTAQVLAKYTPAR